MANILIVEDEKNMQSIIAEYMQRGGHTCFTADDGVDALMILKHNPTDLMILDVMMPHLDGFSVCKMAREMSNLPIIMLTAKSEEEDKLKGYELGADDYITKPFSPKVLLAKVGALLRRSSITPTDSMNAGKITIIPTSHKVFVDGQEITLTHKEYELRISSWLIPARYSAESNCLTGFGATILKARHGQSIRISKPCGRNWAMRESTLLP